MGITRSPTVTGGHSSVMPFTDIHQLHMVLGHIPPRHVPPGHLPPGHLPPGHLPPRTDTP